jgi:hypothetical protein
MDNLIDLLNSLRISETLHTQGSTSRSSATPDSQRCTEVHAEAITAPLLYQHNSPPNTELPDIISDHAASTWIPLLMPIHPWAEAFTLPLPQTPVSIGPSQFLSDDWVSDFCNMSFPFPSPSHLYTPSYPSRWHPDPWKIADQAYASHTLFPIGMPHYGASVPTLAHPQSLVYHQAPLNDPMPRESEGQSMVRFF